MHGTAKRLAVGNDAAATIEDDDQPIIILTMDPKTIPEQEQGNTTTVTVTASRWTGADLCSTDGGGPPDTAPTPRPAGAAGASAEEVAKAVLGPGARPASAVGAETVAVTIGDTGDSAVSGTDYTAVTGFDIVIKAGDTKGTATFSTRGILDSLLEPPETLTVKGAASGTTVTPTKGSVDDKDSAKPSLTLSPTSVSEGAAATTVTVTLDTGGVSASESLDVPFKVSSGTAASGTDFAAVADFKSVLKAGETSVSGTFTLTPTDDTVIEGDETIKVSVPGANPAVEATLTLTDDDSSDITLTASPASVAEGGSAETVTVTAETDGDTFVADRTVTVSVGASGDGATSGTDYAAVTDFDITISAGLTSATGTFTLTPTQDTIVEGDETITVGGTSTGLTVNSDTVTLTDDDSTDITLRVSPSSVAENGGATTVTVTAVTDGDTFSADRTVTVSVGGSNDSATSGTDYAAVSSFDVTISAGDTSGSADFTLTPTQDTIIEGDEAISVDGTSTGLTVNGASVTLTDDDSTEITLSTSPASVSEGASGTSVTVTAATDGDTFTTDRTVTVTVGDSSDSADSGTDYAAVTGFDITISAGQSSGTGTFTLTPTQDTTVEGDESITVGGTSTGLTVNGVSVTLADDDSTDITLTANPDSVSEAASGTSVTVTAATDGDTFSADRTVTVTVGDSSDSADSGTDYAAVTDFDITITAGQTSGTGTFTLTPTQDRIIEGDESITVGGTSTGVTVNGDTVTLTDDDSTDTTLKVTVPNQTGPVKVPEGAEATTVTVTVSTDGDTFKTDRTVDGVRGRQRRRRHFGHRLRGGGGPGRHDRGGRDQRQRDLRHDAEAGHPGGGRRGHQRRRHLHRPRGERDKRDDSGRRHRTGGQPDHQPVERVGGRGGDFGDGDRDLLQQKHLPGGEDGFGDGGRQRGQRHLRHGLRGGDRVRHHHIRRPEQRQRDVHPHAEGRHAGGGRRDDLGRRDLHGHDGERRQRHAQRRRRRPGDQPLGEPVERLGGRGGDLGDGHGGILEHQHIHRGQDGDGHRGRQRGQRDLGHGLLGGSRLRHRHQGWRHERHRHVHPSRRRTTRWSRATRASPWMAPPPG